MNITEFLAIGIVGAVLSMVFQYFKTTSGLKAKLWTVGLSLAVGGVYVWIRDTVYWETVVGILASASTVYALFIKGSNNTDLEN